MLSKNRGDRLSKVKVITDSTSDIPKDLIKDLDITVIPLKVHFGSEMYTDGESMTAEAFYNRLENAEQLPTTSQPSPIHFEQAYKEAIEEGFTEIISIHLSSALSGTFQSATMAKQVVSDEKVRIEIVDSRTATYGIGCMVVAVARAAQAGKSLNECLTVVGRMRKEQVLLAYVDTLEYLKRGGRIGKAAALVGSLLKIKPIISIDDEGEVYAVDKVRGKKKAIRRIFGLLEEQIPRGSRISVAILYGSLQEEADEWLATLQEMYQVQESIQTRIGPVVGTHAGPNSIGLVVAPVNEL